jgi:hypothetical protein
MIAAWSKKKKEAGGRGHGCNWPQCGKFFASPSNLKTHLRDTHKKRRKLEVCASDALEGLARTRVRDDGSCWIYAVLAGLGIQWVQHAKRFDSTMPEVFRKNATARDLHLDSCVRDRIHAQCKGKIELKEILKKPNYTNGGFGGYGGLEHLHELGLLLKIDIILWDEEYLNGTSAPQVGISGFHLGVSASDVVRRRQLLREGPTLVQIARSKGIEQHFEAYTERIPENRGRSAVSRSQYEAPLWLQQAIRPGQKR